MHERSVNWNSFLFQFYSNRVTASLSSIDECHVRESKHTPTYKEVIRMMCLMRGATMTEQLEYLWYAYPLLSCIQNSSVASCNLALIHCWRVRVNGFGTFKRTLNVFSLWFLITGDFYLFSKQPALKIRIATEIQAWQNLHANILIESRTGEIQVFIW